MTKITRLLAGAALGLVSAFLPIAHSTAQETVLHVMGWETRHVPGNPVWDKLVAGFEAEHPGVRVESNVVPITQYLGTLAAMTAAGTLPDVFFGHVKALELGRAGLAVDYTDVMTDEFLDGFSPNLLAQLTTADGAVYALPYTGFAFGIFANDRIMTELGLTVPNTWEELIEMAPKIREAGLAPLAWGNLNTGTCRDFVMPLIAQYGGDARALDELTASWDSEPVIQALTLLDRLTKAGVFLDGVNGLDINQATQIAYQGRAAMLYGPSRNVGIFQKEAPPDWLENFSVHKMPAVIADGRHFMAAGSGLAWVVNDKSPNKELALEFLKYVFSPPVYNDIIAGFNGFPSRPSAMDAVALPQVREMIQWATEDGARNVLYGAGSSDAVDAACQAILDGSIEPAAAAAKMQADVLKARGKS